MKPDIVLDKTLDIHLAAAQDYLSHGWAPIPVPAGQKAPRIKNWQKLALRANDLSSNFGNGENIGLLTGEPSDWLVDVDLDTPEAIAVAADFLPPTDRRHGRPSRRASHWWYRVPRARSKKYRDVDGACLVEIRSSGAQTIVPPSLHPSGESITWDREGDPTPVDLEALDAAVKRVAATALLTRHWPTAHGSRHDLALALGGLLLRGGLDVEVACRIIGSAARAAEDEEWQNRVMAVQDTARNLGAGKPITGATRLSMLLENGDKIGNLLFAWLGLDAEVHTSTGGGTKEERTGGPEPAEHRPTPKYSRPTIIIRPDIKGVVDEAVAALASDPGIELYQRARILVRVERDPGGSRMGIDRPSGSPVIAPVPAPSLRELMARSASWVRRGDDEATDALPPSWAVSTLAERAAWPFPQIEGVVEAPCLRLDGTILEKPGYDRTTGLVYDPGKAIFEPVPAEPSQDDARRALDALVDVMCDFPFLGGEGSAAKTSSDRSAALAAILTVFARPAIDGPTPLFAIRAPAAGTGKTLLADVVAMLATGRPAARIVQGQNEEEDRKRLLAIGLEGAPIVLIDNVEELLGSPALAAALTARSIKDRILGRSRMIEVRLDPIWFATGNNLAFRGDLGRRVVPIDLDAGVEIPEERSRFAHPRLLDWVRVERGRLVVAALTVLRAWIVAGRPKSELSRFGSFEMWSETIRAALVWLGEADPTLGRARIREAGDPEREALQTLVEVWHSKFGGERRALAAAVLEAENDPELKAALAGLDRKGDAKTLNLRRLGYVFRRHNGRIVNGLRLEASAERSREGAMWRVTRVTGSERDDRDDRDDGHAHGVGAEQLSTG